MTPESHRRIRQLFDEALEKPADQRAAFLQTECSSDAELLQAVERLLLAHGESGQFLSRPTGIRRFGRYQVNREIGHGAMGTVYEATDPVIGRSVALKVLRLDSLGGSSLQFLKDRLFQEARSAGMLSHPGIVTVFDVGQEGGEAFIAMELVNGPSLQDFLETNGNLDRAKIIDVLRQTAVALDYAHQRGIIHRDIKPANIMLDRGVTVKIADFGIAKITSVQTQASIGVTLGTPSYMSPEQIQMRKLDGRSDQFSLAVVAFQMLTGIQPFRADSIATLAHQIVYDPCPPACTVNPRLSKSVDRVLQRGLAKDPAQRFGACTEMVQALEEALHKEATKDLAPKGGAKKGLYAGIAILSLVLVAGAAMLYRSMFYPSTLPASRPPAPVAQVLPAPAPVKPVELPREAPKSTTPEPKAKQSPPATAPSDPADRGKELYRQAQEAHSKGQTSESTLLEQAAALGNDRAMLDLGKRWADGDSPNYETAMQWFRKAAAKGNVEAMLNIAFLFHLGNGVTQDYGQAALWYKKAADGGSATAMDNLGYFYQYGRGVIRDRQKAQDYYLRAAALGLPIAMQHLNALGMGKK